jgi:hypothetical protein
MDNHMQHGPGPAGQDRRQAEPEYVWDPEVLRRITEDPAARRELIWLRAMAKADYDYARDIESVDPQLKKRLNDCLARVWRRVRCDPSRRDGGMVEVYEVSYDERWRHHSAHFAGIPCSCEGCVSDGGR